jgi:hypothetical protein
LVTEEECKMKRILLIGALCSLLAFPLHATDIFWDQTTPADPTVTDKDFSHKYGSFTPTKSLEQMDVYDSGERLKLDYEIEAERAVAPPTPSRGSDVVMPQTAPPVTTTQPAPTRRTPSTVAPTRRETTPPRVAPAASDEAPITRPDIPEETKRPTPVPAISEEPTKTEPKKLEWGQKEAKPSSEPQTKFQWGDRPK